MDNTKIEIKVETLTKKWRGPQMRKTNKRLMKTFDILRDLCQSEEYECIHTVKMAPRDTIFAVCSHTFMLFWLTETSVSVKSLNFSMYCFLQFFGKFPLLFLFKWSLIWFMAFLFREFFENMVFTASWLKSCRLTKKSTSEMFYCRKVLIIVCAYHLVK